MTVEQQVSQDERIYGAISYIFFLSIITLLVKKDSAFIRFHSRQGLVLFIGFFFWVIPAIGIFISVISCVGMVIGFINAYKGKQLKMPIVSRLAERINF